MKFTSFHFFSGIGGKALGFAHAAAAHGDATATFDTIGGIDFDPLACRDFEMLVGAPALCADVHELEPADLIRFAGEVAPDVVAMSPPCKGLMPPGMGPCGTPPPTYVEPGRRPSRNVHPNSSA